MSPENQMLCGILGLIGLFLPVIIANHRKHHNENAIFLVTLIAGGLTLFLPIGGVAVWLFALVWASTFTPPKQ